jgi:hypothetical protein
MESGAVLSVKRVLTFQRQLCSLWSSGTLTVNAPGAYEALGVTCRTQRSSMSPPSHPSDITITTQQ